MPNRLSDKEIHEALGLMYNPEHCDPTCQARIVRRLVERLTLGKSPVAADESEYSACPHNKWTVCVECKQIIAGGTKAEVAHAQDAKDGMGGGRSTAPTGEGVAGTGASPASANAPRHSSDPVAQEIERLPRVCVCRPNKGECKCSCHPLAALARRLAAENVALTTCGCGKRLSKPLCGVCDNDD